MTALTPSQQHYIKAIHVFSSDGEGTRICDIAERLSVTKSNVCVAMKTLQRMNLVERGLRRRQVFLTPEGIEQEVLIVDRFTIVKYFMIEVLHITVDMAKLDACSMEHVVSYETICAMCRHVNYTKKETVCSGGCHMQTDTAPRRSRKSV